MNRPTLLRALLHCFFISGAIAPTTVAYAATAGLSPGEIVVVDYSAGTSGLLFVVDPTTGARRVLSNFEDPSQGPTGTSPYGVAVPDIHTILVAEISFLFQVDPTTGFRTIITDFRTSLQGPRGVIPVGVAVIGGQTWVTDRDAGTNENGALFRVNRATGQRTLVSDFGNPAQGPIGDSPHQIARGTGGTILVIDADAGPNRLGALFRIDPVTGYRTIVSDFGDPAQGFAGVNPGGVTQGADGIVWVTDTTVGPGNLGMLFAVNPLTGQRTVVSDFGNGGQGALGADPFPVTVGANGAVLVVDPEAGTDIPNDGRPGGNGALLSVNRTTGARVMLSDFGNAAQGPTGENPSGIAIVPMVQPGDVLFGVISEAIGGTGLMGIDPMTGSRKFISNFTNPAQGPTVPFEARIYDVAIGSDGDLLVIEGRGGGVFVVDRVNGARTMVSNISNAAQGPTGSGLLGITLGVDGNILVTTSKTFSSNSMILGVNPQTGLRTLVHDLGNTALGLIGQAPEDLGFRSANELFVVDRDAPSAINGASHGLLFHVDLTTGLRSVISDFGDPSKGSRGFNPTGLAQQLDGQLLISDMAGSPTNSNFGALFRIDPATGVRTVISDLANASQGLGRGAMEVALTADNEILLLDQQFDIGSRGALFKVDSVTGVRALISNFADATQGPTLITPAGLAIFPTLRAVSSEPTAVDGVLVTNEDTPAFGTLVASDPNGAPLSYAILTNGALGSAVIDNPTTGAYTYSPNPNVFGTDIFSFLASNGSASSNTATVAVTIAPVNDAPTAASGTLAVAAGATRAGTLAAADVESDPLTFSIATLPSKGTVMITDVSTGAYSYSANAGASTTDAFTFKANDGFVDSNVASIIVTITGNQPPVATNATFTTQEDKSVSGVLKASDPEGTKLTYSLASNGAKGSATITNPTTGRFTYVPNANMHGTDSFTFRASDGTSLSNVATVSITIIPVNDAPVASNLTVTTALNTAITGQLAASDADADPLSFAPGKGKGPRRGTVTVSPSGEFTYTPLPGVSGTDSFTFQVSDGTATATGTAAITITP